ncbi:heavy-metal-associated domain-containing protein [Agrococcus sp. HG114]|uniref:heavy-metal-associated domain-containing protein n=1 Tax=Agrococcus sp. HG114 TaxID=2969757 RepID=UPI00215A70FF|nr:heavy metal-associated domain-containing protein [Agrococcus sp. HG114]MCR8670704.1 heavy-metal-associated domain-containing protein [Agrococcus sp. HG114]
MVQNIEIMSTPDDAATEAQAGGCCGGGCCAVPEQSAEAATSQSFEVEGMTCGHCVSSVTEEISGLAGVEGVDVQLVPGGRSKVTVASDAPLRVEDVRAAVSEAGYSLV